MLLYVKKLKCVILILKPRYLGHNQSAYFTLDKICKNCLLFQQVHSVLSKKLLEFQRENNNYK